jgi:hypothetical protein
MYIPMYILIEKMYYNKKPSERKNLTMALTKDGFKDWKTYSRVKETLLVRHMWKDVAGYKGDQDN